MVEKTTLKDRALRAVAIIGLLAVLLLGAWGIIQIAFTLYGFLGNSGTHSPTVAQQTEQTQTSATPAYTAPVPATPTPTPAKPTTPAPAKTPASTYVAAKPAARLFGLPDLSVRMEGVTQNAGRYSVQFTVQNTGTNTAPSGWSFTASLPTTGGYTYTSDPQRALAPGDKIVFTLGFSMQNNSYGYNTYNYGYQNNYYGYGTTYTYPANCGYTQNYTYNGVYNYPGVAYGCNGNYNNTVPYNYGYNNSYGYSLGTVTVTVDPQNYVYESSEYNNTASAAVY